MGVDGRAAAQTLLGFRNIKHGMCLHYVWQAYKAHGATAKGTWPTAYSAWFDTPGKHEGDRNPPAGVPVWFGPKASSSAGDVVISLGGGRVAATDYPAYGQVGTCTIDERQRQIGRPYLGWTETILGARIDFAGEPANVGGGQRTAGPNGVRRRTQPTSQSAEAGEMLAAGVVGNFTGWIRGEAVNGNDVWYQGVSGHWFWSGGFTEGANGAGLKDLNPAAPAPASNQRTVGPNAANGRTGPGRQHPVVQSLDGGTVGTFNGWTRGEAVQGIDVWYRGALNGNWFWAGGFTSQSTEGLPEIAGGAPAPTVPTTPTTPVLDQAYKTFPVDSALATWVGSPNYNYREPRPAGQGPKHITLHWMDGTLAGTDSHFQNPKEIKDGRGTGTASTYGIGLTEIHQYVREADYQQADGTIESNRWGISIEHEGGTGRPVQQSTLDLSAKLCADVARRHGWTELVWMVNVFPHNHWVKTQCPGTLDTAYIIREANKLLAGSTPHPDTVQVDRSLLQNWLDKLKQLLGGAA